jgi:hypothetical protein
MLEAHFGVPTAGGILVAVNHRLASAEVGYILAHSGARYLLLDAGLEALAAPLELAGVTVIRYESTRAAQVFVWEERGLDERISQAEVAAGAIRGETITARARNTSDQPVYHAELRWHLAGRGERHPQLLGTIMPGVSTSRVWNFPPGANVAERRSGCLPGWAGVMWLRRPGGDLQELASQVRLRCTHPP